MSGSTTPTIHRHSPGQFVLLLVFGEINVVASLAILLLRDQFAPAGLPVALLALTCLWGLWASSAAHWLRGVPVATRRRH
jgi:hypothetical protein